MRSTTLYRVLAVLRVLIAAALAASHLGTLPSFDLATAPLIPLGVIAGVGTGVVAALMGVAGGELLIPTVVLLFALDIKVAGSLSVLVSLPTMLVASARFSRDFSFEVLKSNKSFLIVMAAGSILGTTIGGLFLDVVPSAVIIPVLVALLLLTSIKAWRH